MAALLDSNKPNVIDQLASFNIVDGTSRFVLPNFRDNEWTNTFTSKELPLFASSWIDIIWCHGVDGDTYVVVRPGA